tara:strand:- start:337 stop:627 length:291 start_codon:yes stop_codon:yes gene_type:complete
MKRIVFLLVLSLLLSSCAASPEHETSTLGAFIGFIAIIIVAIILGPFIWLQDKALQIKNKKISSFLWIVSIILILIVLFNLVNIFVFLGKLIGLGN